MHLRLALVVLASCGESMPLDEYAPAIWQARCDWYVRCAALRPQDCALHFTAPGEISAAAAKAGLVSYDGEAAAACVALYSDLPCDLSEPFPDFAVCDDVYRGRKEIGEPCLTDVECESEVCWYPKGYCDSACCEDEAGVCDRPRPIVPDAQLGEACNLADDVFCDLGLYCTSRTENGTCAPLPQRGEPCDDFCAHLGDRCDATTNICENASVGGEACMDSYDCTPFYFCDVNSRCVTTDALQPDGSPCGLGHGACQSGWCDDNNVCAPRPVCY